MRIHPHLTVEWVVTFSWDCTMIGIVLHWFRGNVCNLYQQRALKKLWSKCTRTSIVCENKGSKNRKTSNLRHDWVDHQCASSPLLRNKSQLMVLMIQHITALGCYQWFCSHRQQITKMLCFVVKEKIKPFNLIAI